MTIEHAPGTNGHLGHESAGAGTPPPHSGDRANAPVGSSRRGAAAADGRTPHRRVPLDARGLAASAMVAIGVVLILRRIDRGASR